MKKLISLVLVFSILSCNFSALAIEIENKPFVRKEYIKNKRKAYIVGIVAASLISLVVLANSKLPTSVKFGLGYYGGLTSLCGIFFAYFTTGNSVDTSRLLIFLVTPPALFFLGVAGLLPTGVLALNDIANKVLSEK